MLPSPKSKSSRLTAGLPLALLLCLLPLSVAAAPKDLEGGPSQKSDVCLKDLRCRKLYEEARILSRDGKVDEALAVYQQAYELRAAPWLLLNMGRICQRQGKLAEAIDHYRRYLASAKAEESARISKASDFLAEAAAALAAQSPKPTPPPAKPPEPTASVDSRPDSGPPADRDPKPEVGMAEPPPAPLSEPRSNPPLGSSPGAARPSLVAQPADDREATSRRSRLGTGFWVGTGISAALAASALVTGSLALAASAELKETRYIGPNPTSDILALESRTRGLAIGTDVLLGAAGTALVITLAVTLTRKPKAAARPALTRPQKEVAR